MKTGQQVHPWIQWLIDNTEIIHQSFVWIGLFGFLFMLIGFLMIAFHKVKQLWNIGAVSAEGDEEEEERKDK